MLTCDLSRDGVRRVFWCKTGTALRRLRRLAGGALAAAHGAALQHACTASLVRGRHGAGHMIKLHQLAGDQSLDERLLLGHQHWPQRSCCCADCSVPKAEHITCPSISNCGIG